MTVVRVVACCANPVPASANSTARPERARWTEERVASLLDRIRPERPGYANARDACECIGALAFERKQLEGQVAGLQRALVEAAIPLEAIVMAAGTDARGAAVDPHWKEISAAVETIRKTLASSPTVASTDARVRSTGRTQMSGPPDRIWARADKRDGWRHGHAFDAGPQNGEEYVRAGHVQEIRNAALREAAAVADRKHVDWAKAKGRNPADYLTAYSLTRDGILARIGTPGSGMENPSPITDFTVAAMERHWAEHGPAMLKGIEAAQKGETP